MLPFERVSHVSIAVSDLAKARAFYGGIIGLRELPRPDFGFPGAWYDLGGGLQLHIIVNGGWSFRPLVRFDIKAPHFALSVGDADDLYRRLSARGEPFDDVRLEGTGMRQLFLHDQDGNMVEFIGPTREPANVPKGTMR